MVRGRLRRWVGVRRLWWGLMLLLSPLLRLRLMTESWTLRLLVRLRLMLLSMISLVALVALEMLRWAP
jgi:hypothetical protein